MSVLDFDERMERPLTSPTSGIGEIELRDGSVVLLVIAADTVSPNSSLEHAYSLVPSLLGTASLPFPNNAPTPISLPVELFVY